jgi:DNA-binding NarL/FixJ family response regulator
MYSESTRWRHRGEQTAIQLSAGIDLPDSGPAGAGSGGQNLLTYREEQVVALVADGLTNRDVATELGLSEHTVKKYLFRIFDKLGISNRVELVLYAFHHGVPQAAAWAATA